MRRIGRDEWQLVQALRMEALADPDAAIAFLETRADAAAHSESFWRKRTANAAEGGTVAQFLAQVDGETVGSLSVLIRATGQSDHLGRIVDDRRAFVVGVWVREAHRGSGAVDALLTAAAAFALDQGLGELVLDVHRDNHRAQAAYRRAGFEPTGETLTGPIGPELVMVRRLT